jgi:hypothetical protein
MRKLWMAVAGAVVLAIAVAGIASAVNTYDVDIAASTPAKAKGSAAEPVPVKFRFGFEVDDTEGLRPQVIREYRIAAEGVQSFPDARPTCTFEQAADPNIGDPKDLSRACRRAIVGRGKVHNEGGASVDRTQKVTCDVKLTLINISTGDRDRYPETHTQIRKRGGIAIRVDQYVDENGVDDTSRCPPLDVHDAIAAPFYDVKIQGVSTVELRFTVPDTLAHPGGAVDNSLRDVSSTVLKKTGRVRVRGERRKVGFYSAVGRKGRTRTVRVTFIDESDVSKTATAQD